MDTKTLFGIEHPDWYIEELSGCLHTFYVGIYGNMVLLPKKFPFCHTVTINFFSGNTGFWVWNMQDCKRLGKAIFSKLLEDHTFLDAYYSAWKSDLERLHLYFRSFERLDFSTLSDQELCSLYAGFHEAYAHEYAIPLLTNSFAFFAEERLKELLGKSDQDKFSLLTSSEQMSFSHRCELSLLHLAILAKTYGMEDARVQEGILVHVQTYHWVLNHYLRGSSIDLDAVQHDIRERMSYAKQKISEIEEHYRTIMKEKAAFLSSHSNFELSLLIHFIDFFIHWQDDRKAACLEALGFQHQFLEEASLRSGIALELAHYSLPSEYSSIVFKTIDQNMLSERRKGCFLYIRSDGTPHLSTGKEAEELRAQVLLSQHHDHSELSGMVAGTGGLKVVCGTAVVALHSDAHIDFPSDGILVTSMTRPDFVPLMKKAKAIVTNEGGVTCHAAVVSREMHVPCIIGTKHATRIFKTGDRIELDLVNGVVRKVG